MEADGNGQTHFRAKKTYDLRGMLPQLKRGHTRDAQRQQIHMILEGI